MTFKEETRLSPLLLFAVMITSLFGYGLFHTSSNAAAAMGGNGYMAVLLSTLAIIPVIYALFSLQRRFPGKSIMEYAPLLIGRIPALIIHTVIWCSAFIYMVLIGRDASIMVNTYFLDRTPVWMIMLSGFGGIVYLTYHGIKSIARYCSFILIPATTVLVILFLLGFSNIDLRLALPILSPRVGDYFHGGVSVMYLFFPVIHLWILLAFIKDTELKEARKITFWGFGIIAVIFFVETFGAIAALGPYGITRYTWDSMEYVHIIHLPFLILEQAGLVMLIAWIAKIYGAVSVSYWLVAYSVSRIFRQLKFKSTILVLAPVYFVFLLIPLTPRQILLTEQLIQRIGILLFLPYPLILWLLMVLGARKGFKT
ncbi:MAG TPA: GerAB/ArcD/ProY family transporter [Bacillota bacterium]|nr:GerAB/ArcD/ProY family transporter [Bacillota bacterium]